MAHSIFNFTPLYGFDPAEQSLEIQIAKRSLAEAIAAANNENLLHLLECISKEYAGISYEQRASSIVMFLTAKEFRELSFTGMEKWYFGHAAKESKEDRLSAAAY